MITKTVAITFLPVNMNQKYLNGENITLYQGQFHTLTETVGNIKPPTSPPLIVLISLFLIQQKTQVLAQTAGHTKIHGHPQIPGERNSTALLQAL